MTLAAANTTILVLAVLATVGVLGFSIAMIFIQGSSRASIEQRLGELTPDPAQQVEDALQREKSDQNMAESKVMQRMVGITGRIADRAGLLERTENALEQAELPLRPPEALFVYFATMFLGLLLGVLLGGPAAALILVVLIAVLPIAFLHRRRKKRLRDFQTQLPDILNLLAGSMRAGFSFAQGLEAVANEAAEPARRELQRVFTESRLGRPIEDALEDSANRMASVDLMWAVMAIRIQREVGGNLAELLDTVANTMTERERIRHEIKALTAEGRFSGIVLGVFPVAFAGVLYVVRPDYISILFSSSMGILAIVVSAVMCFFGFIWLKKILAIEV